MELPDPSFHLASLLRWLGTFNISVPHSSVENLSDGVALAQVLQQIDSSWFGDSWLVKIKADVGSNWRLKVSNLKKVQERVVDYYQESLGHSLAAFTLPDVNRIGEHGDRTETARLLQLVLGCAIYCDRKEDYIQNIMRLEEDVQQGIMRAIQELEASGMGGDSLAGFAGAGSVASKQALLDALEAANETKEQLSQRCQKLDHQLGLMKGERATLQSEIERLQELLDRDGQSDLSGHAQPSSDVAFRYRDLRQQVETLREEVFKLESSREEYKVRADFLERELESLRSRQEELVSAAESARSLKDEVDILREVAGRAAKAEATAEGLRKRAEECNELRRQMRKLEEKNEELLNQNLVLEEEVKKAVPWKSQLDLHKKQIAELQERLSQEAQRTDKFEFQGKKLQEKLDALQQEKERLAREKDTLKEANEELRFAQLASGGTPAHALNLSDDDGVAGLDTVDMIPPQVREKLIRLQRENVRLLEARSKAVHENGCSEEEKAVLQAMVDDLRQREGDLEAQNRRSNQRLLALESELEELKALGDGGRVQSTTAATEEKEQIARLERELSAKILAVEELEVKLTEQEQRVSVLQEAVGRKEVEMAAMEARYKKYIDKAKKVLKTLESKGGGATDAAPEVVALRAELQEKDRIIESMEREAERNRLVREEADHLMTTAFYNLGMQMQRQAMDQRLGGTPASPSLLTRQRQAVARKTSNLNQGDSYDY